MKRPGCSSSPCLPEEPAQTKLALQFSAEWPKSEWWRVKFTPIVQVKHSPKFVAATLSCMRRWFAILMLVLLPFQFTWAAVASYCGHERGVAAQHFGHHEHQHHADSGAAQADGDGSGKTLGGNDFDCANCHGSCSGIVSPLTGLMSLDVATQPAMLAAGLVRTLVHSPPERPQWAPLA